jgi:glycosyltransferase involved in cell wall biosynthesis
MKRILVIITNPQQASYRLRVDALRPMLAQRGFDLDVQIRPRSWLARRTLLKSADRYHAVLLQRKLLDPTDARLLRRHARRILYDLDDAVMYHANRVGRLSQWRTNRRFEATARILDHVVAGNEYLAAMFRERGRDVTVLPTTVDPAHYLVKEHAAVDPVTLVWIGSNSTLPYLGEHLPALRQSGAKLVTIAGNPLENAGLPVEHIRWSAETEAASLVRGDIGIAPTPCDRWTLGKCGFKIIQYMAAGLPVVASPVGANAEIVRPGGTGFLAETPQEWVDAIRRLAGDVELRRRMGRAGRERVEREYSLTRGADVWARLLS